MSVVISSQYDYFILIHHYVLPNFPPYQVLFITPQSQFQNPKTQNSFDSKSGLLWIYLRAFMIPGGWIFIHLFKQVFMCYLIFSVSKTYLNIWKDLAPRLAAVALWGCITFTISKANKWKREKHRDPRRLNRTEQTEEELLCNHSAKNFSPKSEFSSVQSLSCVQLFATPWFTARQASLSITNSWSSLKLMSIK